MELNGMLDQTERYEFEDGRKGKVMATLERSNAKLVPNPRKVIAK